MGAGRILVLDTEAWFSGNMSRASDGIRRYARSRGWEVSSFNRDESRRDAIPSLLARLRPVGCIVLDNRGDGSLAPRDFARTPVVFFDSLEEDRRRGKVCVVCDNAAAARAAFRELSATLPPCFAVVPSVSLRSWNAARTRTFRALCAEAGLPCRVFPGRREENMQSRLARLAPFIASLPRRCAIFAANDNAAADVAAVASSLGRAIPRELTVIGVDGGDVSSNGRDVSRISSVKLDIENGGFLAARALGALVDGAAAGTERFGPLLVMRRESTRGFGRREPWVLEAVGMIRREACDGLTAGALAARFPVSRNLFERRFREAMGHSVLDEILHVRLEQVQTLLARRDIAIGAIAGLCGFNCEYALRKTFLARFGMSMRRWRQIRAF